MGQKVHPNGFRVGISRKWNNNWFASGTEWKKLFFFQKEVETFFKLLFHYYSYTKISRRKRVLLFDVKFFKYTMNKLFLFIFFYKLRTKRRKESRPLLKNISKGNNSNRLNKQSKGVKFVNTPTMLKIKKITLWKRYKYLLNTPFLKTKNRKGSYNKILNFTNYKI